MYLLFLKFSMSSVWHKLAFLFFCALEPLYQGCSQLPSHVETPQGKKWFPVHCFLADFSCNFMTEFPGAVGQAQLSPLPLSPRHLHRQLRTQFLELSKSTRVSHNRKVQLISHSLGYDRPTQIMSPLTKWRRIWQILTFTSLSEVGPKVNSP